MPGEAAPASLHVVCPHCHTTNRVKAADLGSADIVRWARSHAPA